MTSKEIREELEVLRSRLSDARGDFYEACCTMDDALYWSASGEIDRLEDEINRLELDLEATVMDEHLAKFLQDGPSGPPDDWEEVGEYVQTRRDLPF